MGIEKCLVTTVFSLLQLSLLMDSTVPKDTHTNKVQTAPPPPLHNYI